MHQHYWSGSSRRSCAAAVRSPALPQRGGVGTHQERRVRRARRHRRRRRPDGAPDPGHRGEEQPDEALARRRQQVGRRRGGGFSRRQGREGRSAQASSSRFPICSRRRSRPGVPFNWKDLTPVAMLALDQFVLWVNAETPLQDRQGLHRGGEEGRPQQVQDGRAPAPSRKTRSSPSRIEKATGVKFTYMPFKGGGEVATQLVGKHVDSTVNNPIEAVAHWRAGRLRPLCVFDDQRMPYKNKVTDNDVVGRHPDLQGSGRADRIRDAARHLHAGGRQAGERCDYYVESLQAGCAKRRSGRSSWKTAPSTRLSWRARNTRTGSRRPKRSTATLMKEAGFLAGAARNSTCERTCGLVGPARSLVRGRAGTGHRACDIATGRDTSPHRWRRIPKPPRAWLARS